MEVNEAIGCFFSSKNVKAREISCLRRAFLSTVSFTVLALPKSCHRAGMYLKLCFSLRPFL